MQVKVFIEIPEGSAIKYERDEETGKLTVDRIMPTAMRFPFNYGLIEDSQGEDGDPLDALVFMSQVPVPGVVVKCEVIGVLEMEDEEGIDHKVVCVPVKKVDHVNGEWKSLDDLPEARKNQVKHFFEHYKDLESEKWVKLKGWNDTKAAEAIVEAALKRSGV